MSSGDLGRRARWSAAALGAGLLLATGLPAGPAGAATTTVAPGSSGGFTEKAFDCSTDPITPQSETISFSEGPGTPPSGAGSLKFDLTGKNDDFVDVAQNDTSKGQALSDVTGATYSTYVATAGVNEGPTLGFGIDTNGDGTWDEDLTFYPSDNGGVATGKWQTWTVSSSSTVQVETNEATTTTTFGAYLTAHAAAKLAYVALAFGCAYPEQTTAGGVGYVDSLSITFKSKAADVYDFEAKPLRTGGNGYRMVGADGGIFTFGAREFEGSTGDKKLNSVIVGGATDISDYDGYWIVAADGGVFAFGAEFYGSLGDQKIAAPAAEIESTPSGRGYWIVLQNGKVYTFGDANFFGDMSAKKLNQPIIGMSVTPTGKGYWLVGADGGIFNFGDAGFFGSLGDKKLNKPIIDIAPAVDNKGYYLLGADGGVFTFGSAEFKGSTGDLTLNAPVVGMLVAPTGAGYWLAASDGGVFTFGAIDYLGSMGGTKLTAPVLDLIN